MPLFNSRVTQPLQSSNSNDNHTETKELQKMKMKIGVLISIFIEIVSNFALIYAIGFIITGGVIAITSMDTNDAVFRVCFFSILITLTLGVYRDWSGYYREDKSTHE